MEWSGPALVAVALGQRVSVASGDGENRARPPSPLQRSVLPKAVRMCAQE
jgi:hypothetical protein